MAFSKINNSVPVLMVGQGREKRGPFSKVSVSLWGEETIHNTWWGKGVLKTRFTFQSEFLTTVKVIASPWPSWQSTPSPPRACSSLTTPQDSLPKVFGFQAPARSTCTCWQAWCTWCACWCTWSTCWPAWCMGRSQTFAHSCCRSQSQGSTPVPKLK